MNYLKNGLVILGLVASFVWGAALHKKVTQSRIDNAYQQGVAYGFVQGIQVGIVLNPKAQPTRSQ